MGFEGFSPGWTGKGHAGYAGYAWYRMRIRVQGADEALALLAPTDVDDSYQLFVDGRLIGEFGSFTGSVPTIYYSRPVKYAIPADVLQQSPDGTMELAFRFYMAPRTLLQTFPGGMHAPPIFGFANSINAAYHVAWEELFRAVSTIVADSAMYFVFCFLILMLYFFDRAEKILLWPISAAFATGVALAILFFSLTTEWMSALQQAIVLSVLNPIAIGLWLMTWLVYFGVADKKWLRNLIVALILWFGSTGLIFQLLLLRGTVSHGVFAANTINQFLSSAAAWALAITIAVLGWRRPDRERPALFLALFFYVLPTLEPVLRFLHVRTQWFPFGVPVVLSSFTDIALLTCFSVVVLRHFRNSQRKQQAMEQDVKQAREVQQVLIPEALPQVAGLTIESEYRPAREVGGDFFQIIPEPSDGSVLIVVGDVTGNGLQAGMLVALIVGAIRAEAAHSNDPLTTLNALNQRLCGRGQAHATGLALRVAQDGAVTLANAGHLPPYLNGKELPMEGALPLGMTPAAKFSLMHFQLDAWRQAAVDVGWRGGSAGRGWPAVRIRAGEPIAGATHHCSGDCGGGAELWPAGRHPCAADYARGERCHASSSGTGRGDGVTHAPAHVTEKQVPRLRSRLRLSFGITALPLTGALGVLYGSLWNLVPEGIFCSN